MASAALRLGPSTALGTGPSTTPLVLWHLVLYPVPVGSGQVRPKYRAQGPSVPFVPGPKDQGLGLEDQGQRAQDRLRADPIPGFQLCAISKVERPQRAGSHARRGQSRVQVVGAEGALGHVTGLGVVLRRAVRTGPTAIFAPDALVGVYQHYPVGPLGDGLRRADLDANRLLAVVAGQGNVVGKHARNPGLAAARPVAARHLIYPAPQETHSQTVFVLARHLAGLAAGAGRRVEVEGVLFGHDSR